MVKNMLRQWWLLCVLVPVNNDAKAQYNLLISQYMYNGLTLNPAYAGSQHKYSLAFMYRDQWTAVEGSPNYRLVTMHTPLFNNRVGAGLFFNQEKIGVHSNQNLYAQLAYKLRIGKGFLSMGLAGGGSFRQSNYRELILQQPQDPLFNENINYFTPNVGLGLYYYTLKMYAGVSSPYILPNYTVPLAEGLSGELRGGSPLYLTAGTVLGKSNAVKFYPSLLYSLRSIQNIAIWTLDINTNLIFYDRVMVGLSYRTNGSLVLLHYLILGEKFRITYSYDMLVSSRLASAVSGTHEIMLNYRVEIFKIRQRCSAYF